jgi:hypothetical protein
MVRHNVISEVKEDLLRVLGWGDAVSCGLSDEFAREKSSVCGVAAALPRDKRLRRVGSKASCHVV